MNKTTRLTIKEFKTLINQIPNSLDEKFVEFDIDTPEVDNAYELDMNGYISNKTRVCFFLKQQLP